MKRLVINKQIFNDKLVIELVGTIDEDADFSVLLELKQKAMDFNFDKVAMINSCGIREWIKFIAQLPADIKIAYQNCPQIIIEQINMVHGFFKKGATIESFYAPFFCEACDHEVKVFLKSSQIIKGKAPEVVCPQCKKEKMEFDAIADQYFMFLKSKK